MALTLEQALDLIDNWYDAIITDSRGLDALIAEADRDAIMQAVERKAFANLARGSIVSGGGGGSGTGGGGYQSTATIQRLADTNPYIINDVYGSTFELTNFAPAGGFVYLVSIDIIFNITALPVGMGAFSLFLYESEPSAIGDNDAFSISAGDKSIISKVDGIYLGTAKLAKGGGSVVLQADQINLLIYTPTSSVWGRLVSHGGFTPAAALETAILKSLSLGV